MNAVVTSAQAVQGNTGTIVLAVAWSLVALFALCALVVVLRRSSRAKTTVSATSWIVFTTALIGVAVVGGSLTWSPAAFADPGRPVETTPTVEKHVNVSEDNDSDIRNSADNNTAKSDSFGDVQLPTLPFDAEGDTP